MVIDMSAIAKRAIRCHYEEREYREISTPLLVQNQCEGGSTLFKIKYFGEDANLSQSSQFYLEAMTPVKGNVYSISKSFRAEHSRTKRHLSEYDHVEAESEFITFDDLLNQIEDLLVDVSEKVLQMDGETLLKINPVSFTDFYKTTIFLVVIIAIVLAFCQLWTL